MNYFIMTVLPWTSTVLLVSCCFYYMHVKLLRKYVCPKCNKKVMTGYDARTWGNKCHSCYRFEIFGPDNGVRTYVVTTKTEVREVKR